MSIFAARRRRPRAGASLPVFAACLAALVAVSACSDDPEPITIDNNDNQAEVDAGPSDAADDADVEDDAGDEGDDYNRDEIDPTQCASSSTTVETSPEARHEIPTWRVGAPSSGDPVHDALLAGEFELPAPFSADYGTDWNQAETGENGAIPTSGMPSGDVVYAGTTIEVEQPQVRFARADDLFGVYVNGFQQPGDVYGAGDKRIPIPLKAGENEILLRYTGQHSPEFDLYQTPDDLFFNTEDITDPDLRVGTDRTEQLGFPVLNLSGQTLSEVEARVVENDYFEESVVEHPALAPDATTQLAFELEPKDQWQQPDREIPVQLEVASCQSDETYRTELTVETVAEDATFNRTFRSPVDNSVQYYGVVPPLEEDDDQEYGVALSMHGASVEASSQAGQYVQKESMYIVAPTNRRPFGFDWEEWGRLNGLASLDHAKETFNIDETRVYATGHSMGGHGTWHMGAMHPGKFAAFGPSAGWATFYSYGGANQPDDSSLLYPARAHSDTYAYMSNLRRRGVYLLHGDEDIEVPLSEGLDLCDAASDYTGDVRFHIEPGVDHWWEYDDTERQECVDWPEMMEFFKDRTLDPYELEFEFRTPGQWIGADHSYVSLQSTEMPFEDAVFVSEPAVDDPGGDECDDDADCSGDRTCYDGADPSVCLGTVDAPCDEEPTDADECSEDDDCDGGLICDTDAELCVADEECDEDADCAGHRVCGDQDGVAVCEDVDDHGDVETVELQTDNVRSMDIDADALADRGVDELVVDGDSHDVSDGGTIRIGPEDGKDQDAPGLINPTFQRPFCFVYPDDESKVYRAYVSYLLSEWSLTGNGHGCGMPVELLTDEIAGERNLIFVGVDFEEIPDHEDRPFEWDDETYTVGDNQHHEGAGFVTFPHGDHQSAAFIAAEGDETQLFGYHPFSSRSGMPDYLFLNDGAAVSGGYFDGDWEFDDGLGG